MNERVLKAIQNALAAALSFVLVLVVFMAFLRVVRQRDPGPVSFGTSTTTTTPGGGETTTTTTSGGTPVASSTTTTTLAPATFTCAAPRPEATDEVTLLRVYYSCGDPAGPPVPSTYVVRAVPATKQVLTATLSQMLGGPNDTEQSVGFNSYMSSATGGALRGVNIAEGVAVIDLSDGFFSDFDPATNSVDHLLSDLNANVFQFDTISGVEYRLGGSCSAFWSQVGGDGCTIITRSDWNQQKAAWTG